MCSGGCLNWEWCLQCRVALDQPHMLHEGKDLAWSVPPKHMVWHFLELNNYLLTE